MANRLITLILLPSPSISKLLALSCCLLYALSSFAQPNFESSNLPILQIFTNGVNIPDEPKIDATMGIIYNGPGNRNKLTDPFNEYDGVIGIEIRGATSQTIFDKKSYGLETRDSLGENRNVSLLGMPRENDWVLHGPYSDKSLMRNALAYKTARSFMSYAPRGRFVELMINDEYEGLYFFTEKVKRDKNRVAISPLTPADNSGDQLTGGYILKLDKEAGAGQGGFVSDYDPLPGSFQQTYYQYHYPKPDDITSAQENYIETFIGEFEDLMASDTYADSLNNYNQYIDRSTFVDFFIVNELFKNVDAYRLSTYLYKDRDSIDGRLKLGPVWDFNLGTGNIDFCAGPSPEGWVKDYNTICPGDGYLIPFWWEKLWKDKKFREAIYKRWMELRKDQLSDEVLFGCIDSFSVQLEEAQERNFERWPVLATYVWPNWFVGDTYEEEVDYLSEWLKDRIIWIESQMEFITLDIYDPKDFFIPRVFPNPFHNELTFEYYIRSSQSLQLQLFDAQGKLVAQSKEENQTNGLNQLQYNGVHLAPGIYFYKIWIDNQIETVGKIVKSF